MVEWGLGSGEVVSICTLAPGPANKMNDGGRLALPPPKKQSFITRLIASF